MAELDAAVEQAAENNPQARLLMTQPGVGPNTALAFFVTIGDVSRFKRDKQVASYLHPSKHKSTWPSRSIIRSNHSELPTASMPIKAGASNSP